MAKTVNEAFQTFLKEKVNLDPDTVSAARKSRDNLLNNIAEFDDKEGFFDLCDNFNYHFGSFARKTKCRELDDIDLMIGIAANGAQYDSNSSWNDVVIYASNTNQAQKECLNNDGRTLNSTKVANLFKKKLEKVREYSHSDIRRNGEVIVLNLVSKDWSFDIVPCFHTETESDGRSYYLIPNGRGNWKKTAPDKDQEHVTNTNQAKKGRMLELIRLCKKWMQNRFSSIIPSYVLETMIVNYADSINELNQYIDFRFRETITYLSNQISRPIYDLKEIQGNINCLSIEEQTIMKRLINRDIQRAQDAWKEESNGNQREAIRLWGEIFGSSFPRYEE